MSKPKVEFFSDDVDGVEFINIGLVWIDPRDGEEKRAVLGAFQGDLSVQQMTVIGGIAEQAAIFVLGLEEEWENDA